MKILLFGGTSEGRLLAGFLNEKKIDTVVSVATEYGKELAGEDEHISVRTGRLSARDMEEIFPGFDLIIDATHPYAYDVTENIREAAGKTGVRCLRLIREEAVPGTDGSENNGFEAVFDSVREAAFFLKDKKGNIFISTGAKELNEYTVIPNYGERLVVRILPFKDSLDICKALGIRHVICGKGPFSGNENLEHFGRYDVKYLVTKDGGIKGGLREKLAAAEELGIKVILIRRKKEKEGFSLEDIMRIIEKDIA